MSHGSSCFKAQSVVVAAVTLSILGGIFYVSSSPTAAAYLPQLRRDVTVSPHNPPSNSQTTNTGAKHGVEHPPCRHFCMRLQIHARGLSIAKGYINASDYESYSDFIAGFVDTSNWRCEDLHMSRDAILQHSCNCEGASALLNNDVPSGMEYGSVQLWEYLRRFAVQQRYILEWLSNKYDKRLPVPKPVWDAKRSGASPYGCEIEEPTKPIVVVYTCGSGGVGDQTKGLLQAFMLSLMAPIPHAFVFRCETALPIDYVWLPHNSSSNIAFDWTIPPWLSKFLDPLTVRGGEIKFKEYTWPDNAASYTGVADFLDPNTDYEVKMVQSNAYFHRYMKLPVIVDAQLARAAKSHNKVCGIPPELADAMLGTGHEKAGDVLAATTYDPFASVAKEHASIIDPRVQELVDGFNCHLRRLNQPLVHAVAPGFAAGSSNLAIQLFHWIVRPSNGLKEMILTMKQHYDMSKQLVLGVHVRVGTPPAGAFYLDPARDPADLSAKLVERCMGRTVLQALHMYPDKPEILMYVSADNRNATQALRQVFSASTYLGKRLTLLEVPTNAATVHVGNTPGHIPLVDRLPGFMVVYLESFLLSAVHGIVRSRSGFSEMAQGFGRVPVAFRFLSDAPPDFADLCLDFSQQPFMSVQSNGLHWGLSDAALLQFPQVMTDVTTGM